MSCSRVLKRRQVADGALGTVNLASTERLEQELASIWACTERYLCCGRKVLRCGDHCQSSPMDPRSERVQVIIALTEKLRHLLLWRFLIDSDGGAGGDREGYLGVDLEQSTCIARGYRRGAVQFLRARLDAFGGSLPYWGASITIHLPARSSKAVRVGHRCRTFPGSGTPVRCENIC